MSVNNLFEVAFVRRGERGWPAVSAYEFISTEVKSVIWTDFRETEEA